MITGVYRQVAFHGVSHDDRQTPVTKTGMGLSGLLARQGGGDFLRSLAGELIMEAGVEGLIAASQHEGRGDRATWRSGSQVTRWIPVWAR